MTKEELALEVIDRLKKEYPDAGCTLDYDQAWKLLVSVRLAAQCTDARVNVVVEKLYEKYPDQYIGIAGPYDAVSPHYDWVANRYLAIDQGTIAPMIENHRTGLLWDLFMNAPEIKEGLNKLGFTSSQHSL